VVGAPASLTFNALRDQDHALDRYRRYGVPKAFVKAGRARASGRRTAAASCVATGRRGGPMLGASPSNRNIGHARAAACRTWSLEPSVSRPELRAGAAGDA